MQGTHVSRVRASLIHLSVTGYYFHSVADKTQFQRADIMGSRSHISETGTEIPV